MNEEEEGRYRLCAWRSMRKMYFYEYNNDLDCYS
jgi:hypothetical protein